MWPSFHTWRYVAPSVLSMVCCYSHIAYGLLPGGTIGMHVRRSHLVIRNLRSHLTTGSKLPGPCRCMYTAKVRRETAQASPCTTMRLAPDDQSASCVRHK